jgi:hypothetical protein
VRPKKLHARQGLPTAPSPDNRGCSRVRQCDGKSASESRVAMQRMMG